MNLNQSVFIITGGASGLGEACVKRFAQAGAKVVIVDKDPKGQAVADRLGAPVRFTPCDITSEEDVMKALRLSREAFGQLDGLINCAGLGSAQKIINKDGVLHSLEAFSKTLQVNLIGTFNMIRLCVGAMVSNPGAKATEERGIILNTASVAAYEGQIGQCAYAASKGGIVAMTLPLARELAQHGIRVCTIAPGIFKTPMLSGLDPKVQTALGEMIPFPSRLGEPDEFASLAQHICENQMLNGEVIRLDGALRMSAK